MKKSGAIIIAVLLATAVVACNQQAETKHQKSTLNVNTMENGLDTITLGAGCFWCVEAIFQSIEGVVSVESGYSNGTVKNPSYKEVCTGTTGHAEVCRIIYNPAVVDFSTILEAFWASHDPTTVNRQGADVGTQYRSAIFYHTDSQRAEAEKYKARLNAERAFNSPVVTEIAAVRNYSAAEDYHQNYFNNNPNQPYCSRVIGPKLDKFKKVFGH